jgi:predicted nucleotidyltransferase component of viral defense system
MNDQILIALKRRLEDIAGSGNVDVETQRNVLKEELQYYVLNFVYHHPEFSRWTMYGGSALRICHRLNRMSVDLDFEVTHPITEAFLSALQDEIASHFANVYGSGEDLLTIKPTTGRGLLLRFHIGDALAINHPSKQLHVKIDLNHFIAPKSVVERRPINRDQLSFVIRTYNMATLMASKIAAIFLRGQRGVGTDVYEEKGRDIYDLLWYMEKKVVPDLDYLRAKGVDAGDPRSLFDRLTLQMNKVNDANLKQDLTPLFMNRTYIEHWLQHWRESYLRLVADYKIRTVTALKSVGVQHDFPSDNYSLAYSYGTDDGSAVYIVYAISRYWISDAEGNMTFDVDENIAALMDYSAHAERSGSNAKRRLLQYATLFYQKTEKYLEKRHRIFLGDAIVTKLIRMTADNLNQKEEILLNKSALLSAELDDLLK